jgi:epoxide hydrolase-like predicted phosphatase
MSDIECVILDWGGVLTQPVDHAVSAWMQTDGIDEKKFEKVMGNWLGPVGALEAHLNPVHALERGEIEVPHFEERLAIELTKLAHHEINHHGLLQRMFDHFTQSDDMRGLIYRLRNLGYKTALLSNSWGNEYPRSGWDEMFDVVVISGEVGMRKPEHRIYELTLSELEVPASASVFIDDIKHNIVAAVELGITGIHHQSYHETKSELTAILDTDLG